ncbi:MAG: hypothetical protein P0Y53_03810 [Candidatus Pseudobacter hemicellulosilyticus]|uniref:Uncharacterized protein n=1 Tax=Candidatus Pseudobacter hemicellulosilyticus TaxID=3121375 RepID=A0AAJ5WW18_9BACT|nr:MAG: hypothetical protein P0Y53_03810 [Pseudobacter sp.]
MAYITFSLGNKFRAEGKSANLVLSFNKETQQLTITSTQVIDFSERQYKISEEPEEPTEHGMVCLQLDTNIQDDAPVIDVVSVDTKTFYVQPQVKVSGRKRDNGR